jgi:uncharacterized SAM-binding protein YcdF (DUF218 family)
MGESPSDMEIGRRLFLAEEPIRAEVALVFGSCQDDELRRRALHGAVLYAAGLVPRLLLSGGDPERRGTSEARRMAEVAAERGAPPSALLLEERSRTTVENVQLSLRLLRSRSLLEGLGTILLVSAEWHLARARYLVRRVFPPDIRLVCCATPDGCTRANWATREEYRQIVYQEWLLCEPLFGHE